MIIREGIEVTNVTLEDYELPILEGLSEFLLRAGYGVYGGKEESSSDVEILSNYDKEVVLKDGKLRTILTYKGNKKKRGKKS
ncbi:MULTISPECIES: hypothetical protein [Bacillus]|uniref:Uncharacterized protein n=1 Tax=Bacillus mycoides TaxID=1405 RepID=A0A3D9TZZ1_BACMY|nr:MULTISPECIES: hypothetical protein [Bacillus]RBP17817.1 hypothetical protein DET63_12731 [Bacillus sp. DB-2]REF18331.1 hypothetical protein DET55_14334 [Bacillus mycoides]